MKRKRVLPALTGLLVFASLADAGYVVSLSDVATESSATESLKSLQALGYTYLEATPSENGTTLSGGNYKYYLDAYAVALKLKKRGFLGTVKESADADLGTMQFPDSGVPSPPSAENQVEAADTQPIYEMIKGHSTADALQQLSFQLSNLSPSDPLSGFIDLRRAYLYLRDKNNDDASKLLEKIVTGQTQSTVEIWLESADRLARLKQAANEKLAAYEIFRTLEKQLPADKQKDDVRLQIVGLMLELVRSSKGSYADLRDYADYAVSQTTPSNKHDLVAIKLIAAESYYHEGNSAEALTGLEQLITQYRGDVKGVEREIGMALVFYAITQKTLGNYDSCRTAFVEACEIPYPAKAAWKHIPNMKKFAAQHFKAAAKQFAKNEDVLLAEQYISGN